MLDTDKQKPSKDSTKGSDNPMTESERLLESARVYFSSDFMNLTRDNCPSEEALNMVVRSGEIPHGELRAHFFGCSECFSAYQSLRAFYRNAAPVSNLSLLDKIVLALRIRPLPIFTSLIVGICVIAGFLMWRNYVREEPLRVVDNIPLPSASSTSTRARESVEDTPASDPEVKISAAKQKKREPQPRVEKKPARPAREMMAAVTVKLDLERYALLRGNETNRETLTSLSPARNRLVVTLPTNSPKGLYSVSVMNAYGRELMSKKAMSANGETLTTNLDMRALPANKYRLCISLPEEAPDCYPFIVVRK